MEPVEAARGALTIATSRMADAIREVLAEQGVDPRQAALIAFGGAGPLFSTMLAAELEIRELVIPPHAGTFSAWGLLQQDLLQSAARTTVTRLDAPGLDAAHAVLGDLFAKLAQRPSVHAGTAREASLDMRYAGQDYTLSVTVPLEDALIAEDEQVLAGRFAREYERTFGHVIDEDVEIVAVRASVRTALPRRTASPPGVAAAGDGATPAQTLDAFSFSQRRWLSFAVVDRSSLPRGAVLEGPAIVSEEAATTYLDAGYELRVHTSGAMLIVPGGS
jgi:N-methylhydantoinase A